MIKKFTIYDNHYYTFWNFSKEKKQILALAILEYMFEDITPDFDSKKDRDLYGAWCNLERLLSKNKNQIIKASDKSKIKVKSELKFEPKCQVKPKSEYATNNILDFIFNNYVFIQDRGLLRGKIEEWIQYKEEKGKPYNAYSLKSLLNKIETKFNQFGEEKIIELIDYSLSNGYDGLIWKNLEEKETKPPIPEWLHNQPEREEYEFSDEDKKRFGIA